MEDRYKVDCLIQSRSPQLLFDIGNKVHHVQQAINRQFLHGRSCANSIDL